MPSPVRSFLRFLRWLFVVFLLIAITLLLGGSNLLISKDPIPSHVDAVVVLQGSILGEQARLAGAIDLLKRGVADRLLLNIPKEGYWGQSLPPVVRAYVERNYGTDLAARIDFCEMGPEVNSTAQEAEAAIACIKEHHWGAITVVTSDYHTRRAGILWRKAVKKNDPSVQLTIAGVEDPEFVQPWWRHRLSAKTWLEEFAKLITTLVGG